MYGFTGGILDSDSELFFTREGVMEVSYLRLCICMNLNCGLPYIWIKIAVPLPFEELLISLGNAVIKISATNVIAPSNRKY